MLVIVEGSVREVKTWHPAKQSVPKLLTLSGIVSEDNESHDLSALLPSAVSEFGSVIDVSIEWSFKANGLLLDPWILSTVLPTFTSIAVFPFWIEFSERVPLIVYSTIELSLYFTYVLVGSPPLGPTLSLFRS